MANRRKERRSKLIEMSGGKCVKCGSIEELHFDHEDPEQQEFRLNGNMLDGPWKRILEEWSKCQLLCRVCHVQKTKQDGSWATPWNKGISKTGDQLPEHGTETSYVRGCRCDDCYQARRNGRIRRGEIKGIRELGSRNKVACGEMASCSAVTGVLSVRVGLGQP